MHLQVTHPRTVFDIATDLAEDMKGDPLDVLDGAAGMSLVAVKVHMLTLRFAKLGDASMNKEILWRLVSFWFNPFHLYFWDSIFTSRSAF